MEIKKMHEATTAAAGVSDPFQLVTFAAQCIMPLRPEQVAGLLISEIDWENRTLFFGDRFGGFDFTKGKTTFRVPFPRQWDPVFRYLVGGRVEGPVYRSRMIFEAARQPELVLAAQGQLEQAVRDAVTHASLKENVTVHDAKGICREVIARAGGITPDSLRQEFRKLAHAAGLEGDYRYYDLRDSVNSEMHRIGIDTPTRHYQLGHSSVTGGSEDSYLSLAPESLRELMQKYWGFCDELISAVVERGHSMELW